ncbi:MAG: hypothetical protein OEY85_14275, partial [Rhodospirillales bacterium]|nr:hypothetical protein [Rhodospirillales bacterium]
MGFYDFLRFGGHFGLRALSLAIFSIPLLGMTLSGDGANAQSRFQSPTPSPSQSAAQPPAQPTVMTEADKKAATDILFRAVSNNDLATVQATIAAGANIEATNQWGIQPVELAVDKGYFEIAHFLLSVRNVRRQSEDKTQLASRQQASVFPAQPEPSLAPPPPAPGTPLAAKQVPVIKAPLTPKPDETITARTLKGPNPFDPATTPPGASLPIVSGSAAASSIARPRLTGPRAVASPAKPYVNQPRQPVSPTVKPAANQPRQSVPPAAKPAANQPAIEPITQLAAKPISQAPAPREELAEDPEKMDLADRFFTNIIEALEGKKPETKAAPQTAMVTQPKFVPVPNSRPKALPANHLKGTVLALGTSSGLGVAPGKNSSCVLNNQVSLCIETLQWPPEVAG